MVTQEQELKRLLKEIVEFLWHSPADYSNGNVCQGVDEGDYLAGQAISSYMKRAYALGVRMEGYSPEDGLSNISESSPEEIPF